MNEFLKELNNWLKEKEKEHFTRANECNSFEEVGREDALEWCAFCYKETQNKIKELKRKYNL